jgi:argininosuccinate lyase
MSLIWDKGKSTVNARIQAFAAGEDVMLDRVLFVHDIVASKGHVKGLARIKILSATEEVALLEGLDRLKTMFENGEFVLDERFEDGHSAIEAQLTEWLGESGKKVHTGRSRNDQVLVATRLYLKAALDELASLCEATAHALLDRAEAEMWTPMPGYTHLQRAVPSSVGMWLAGLAEGFIDDAELARMTFQWVDQNPLGTAAGYGVNIPLDRAFVTEELGFARMQVNPIYAQNSRGKFEIQVIDCLCQAMLDVRRFAWDLSLYTTAEFDFVHLPDDYTTGSSIMPNKRNPDIVELLRGTYGVLEGARVELAQVLSLPSGYHRDLQNTKPPLIRAVEKGLGAMALMSDLVQALEFNREAMHSAISPDMYATDLAVEMAARGVPFREAYREAAAQIPNLVDRAPQESLKVRTSPGGAANPMLDVLRARLKS